MLDIAALQAICPSLSTLNSATLAPPTRPKSEKKHARSSVVRLIENSIALFNDPNHKIYNKRTKNWSKPEKCFKLNPDGTAYVWLSYSKKKLKSYKGDDFLTMPASALPQMLEKIKEQVASGILDSQIEPIHKERSDAMSKKKKPATASGSTSKNAA